MSGKSIISNSYLEDIGDAIRYKKGTEETYYPSQMGDAIRSIEGIVPVGSIEVDANGTYNVTEKAEAVVNVQPVLEPLAVSENGSYVPSEGTDGYSEVTVDVEPSLESLSVTENGLYLPESGTDGFDRVTVAVPQPSGSIEIVQNGTYNVSSKASAIVDVWATGYSDDVDDFSGGNILALVSHAQEYIDTGYYPTIDVEMRLKIENNAYSNQYGGFCCVAYSASRIGCQYQSSNYDRAQFYTTINLNYSDSVSLSEPFWIRSLVPYQTQEQADRPLIIFYVYRNQGYDRKSGMTFYGLKCYENKKLVKKYVPWLDENNVPCVKELIDNELFYNVGTGAFGYIDLQGNTHDA